MEEDSEQVTETVATGPPLTDDVADTQEVRDAVQAHLNIKKRSSKLKFLPFRSKKPSKVTPSPQTTEPENVQSAPVARPSLIGGRSDISEIQVRSNDLVENGEYTEEYRWAVVYENQRG